MFLENDLKIHVFLAAVDSAVASAVAAKNLYLVVCVVCDSLAIFVIIIECINQSSVCLDKLYSINSHLREALTLRGTILIPCLTLQGKANPFLT